MSDANPNVRNVPGARRREPAARHLARHPDEVLALLEQKKRRESVAFADVIAADAPVALAATDPALYRTYRAAVTEIYARGLALNADELRRLAGSTF